MYRETCTHKDLDTQRHVQTCICTDLVRDIQTLIHRDTGSQACVPDLCSQTCTYKHAHRDASTEVPPEDAGMNEEGEVPGYKHWIVSAVWVGECERAI